MRRLLFPALSLLLVLAAALLAWLWWSDAVLIDRCLDAGGRWDRGDRVCAITAAPASPASPHR